MERKFYDNRKKGVNCNKPYRRERERERRERENQSENPNEIFSLPHNSNKPPPWLKGKQIGLWYRDRNREKNLEIKPVILESQVLENILLTIFSESEGESTMKEGAFKESFLYKITMTFEDKLNLIKNVNIEPDKELDEKLYYELLEKKKSSKEFNEMIEFRKTLPSYKKRKEIINLINNNQIIIVSGETGCGKTTQIVQFILDDHILNHKGSLCTSVCTQPRRISAISVAERVAAERAEHIGESVGYIIRLESELPKRKRGTITFVTTGILIQLLQSDPSLCNITHLFIDEIHERNIMSDFVITLLKLIILKRPDLKIILMSATINAEQFSHYFGGVPCIEIPGCTYPVEELYLEDILEKVHFTFFTAKRYYERNQKKIDPVFTNYVLPYINELEKANMYSESVIKELRKPESEILNLDLIAAVIFYINSTEPEGAILTFVPGLSQIQNLHKILTTEKFFSSSRFWIIPLHSIMSTENQRKAFKKPPKGVRKIIISTSIAETSITINDVKYVVDCGKFKTKNFDLEKNVATLEPEWETLANAQQRKGRAGRIQAGKCFKLYTKARQEIFEPYPLPEMQRSSLEDVILNAKFLQLGRVKPFLEKVMDPPDLKAVDLSLKLLKILNVLDSDEKLTPLGFHLAKLPLNAQTGKMILMGALFSCLDPILSISACLNFKDPFVFDLNKEIEIQKTKMKFARGEKSDHFMLSEAFREWEKANEEGLGYEFATNNYLSHNNLQLLCFMKKQFAKHLHSMNFLVSDDPKHPKSNINSDNVKLIKAIVYSGLYPNIAMIRKILKKNSENPRVFWKTLDHPKVEFHVKSVLRNLKHFESPFVVYFEKVKSTSIFLYEGTMIYPMALLFFSEQFKMVGENNVLVDNVIKIPCSKKTGLIVEKLRNKLLWILESVISNPGVIDWEKEDKRTLILKAIVEVITTEDKT